MTVVPIRPVARMARISVRVPESHREQAEKLAKRLDRHPSWVYRQAIRAYLEQTDEAA